MRELGMLAEKFAPFAGYFIGYFGVKVDRIPGVTEATHRVENYSYAAHRPQGSQGPSDLGPSVNEVQVQSTSAVATRVSFPNFVYADPDAYGAFNDDSSSFCRKELVLVRNWPDDR